MKILVCTPYFHPQTGGLETYACELALALTREHHYEVVIATSGSQRSGVLTDQVDGLKVYRLPTWFKFSNTPVNPFWPTFLRKIIKAENPDVIHAHTPVPFMADAAAMAAGKKPFYVTYHASTLDKPGPLKMRLATKLYRLYQPITLNRANGIFAVSEFVKSSLGQRYASKTKVIPNSVWKNTAERKPPVKDISFIFIGSLDHSHKWKGLEEIIDALSVYPGPGKLIVIGDGDGRADYETQVEELKLHEKVKFYGTLAPTKRDELLKKATALICYPTTENDAFPTVILEAWKQSVPVIGAAIGAIPQILGHGKFGYLAIPAAPADLAIVMGKVVTDPGKNTIIKNASKILRAEFTWDRQAKKMSRILEGWE
jgi:glycosyltransferase involved in cell wall biosynthesis